MNTMQEHKSFSIEDVSLTWLTLGGLVVCASILLGVIYVTKPLIHKSDSSASFTQSSILVSRAEAHTSDSASLYPPQQ